MGWFRICGLTGLALSALTGVLLAQRFGLSVWVVLALWLLALAVAWALAVTEKFFRGSERLVYYHHQIAVLGVAALALRIAGLPVLAYLDIAAICLGVFLACGRVGCLLVGCCHGQPHRFGIKYRSSGTEGRVSRWLDGVRLFPVQAAEMLWVLGLIVAALFARESAGSVFTFYVGGYAVGRIWLEFFRGDVGRPYLWRLSEAQWTSLAVLAAVAIAGIAGVLPLSAWPVVALPGLVVAGWRDRAFFEARHVREVAEALETAREQSLDGGRIYVAETSLGVRISASTVFDGGTETDVFAFSRTGTPLRRSTARRLGSLAARLRRGEREAEFSTGKGGVYHLLIPDSRSADAI